MAPKRQNEELERLRLACNVESTETVAKAQEILRRMDTKCRPGTLGRGDLFRTCIAFDLACRVLNCPVPLKTAVKLCGAPSEGVYVAALGTAQRLLGVQRRYTCKEIAESVGDKSAGMKAAVELKGYKERFLASYPVRQVSSLDLDGTVYAVAAFYLCAKKLKHPVDKQRLLDLSLVREDEFMAVCRSMLDLCYSTLGVSVSDKPTTERLSRFQKAAALNSRNNGSSSAPSGVKDEQCPPGSAAQGPARSATAASSGPQRRNSGGFAPSGARRRIPLSGGRDRLGAPGSHVTALARSIQAATQRKRHGGMMVAPLEPGGSNEANDSLNDRTHHRPATKRPRPTAEAAEAAAAAPPAETAGGGPEPHVGAACSSTTVPARCTDAAPPRPAVCNPHVTAALASPAAAISATASGSGADNGPAAAVGSASRAPPTTVRNPYAPKPCAAVRNPYAGGSGKRSGGRGRAGANGSRREGCVGGTGPGKGGEGPRGDAEYTAWKQRVLASMENRMKETRVKEGADSSSPAASTAIPAFGGSGGGGGGAPGGGSESSQRDNAPVAAAIVPEGPSAPEAASPAAAIPAARSNDSTEARAAATPRTSTKDKSTQPSLTSFFAPVG